MFERKYIQTSNPYSKETNKESSVKNIYYGEVVSISDQYEGGRIKVRIPEFDKKSLDNQLPYAYPIMPKFFHIYPQEGEMVRVFIEDTKYPQRGRHWIGSVVSQLQKIGRDGYLTSLSTTNVGFGTPDKAVSTYPDAVGVFPNPKDVALIGRDNTDIQLKDKQVLLRVGKHEVDNVLKLNKSNPAFIQMDITPDGTRSTIIQHADKIAFITKDGNPKLPDVNLDADAISKIFDQAHPLGRGDLIVQAFEIVRRAIILHIHGYSTLPADKNDVINSLEKIDFTQILQNNIRIN